MTELRCSRCDRMKHRSLFAKGARDGKQPYCRSCARDYRKGVEAPEKQPRAPAPKPERLVRTSKLCQRCGVEKDRDQFYLARGEPDGLYGFCKPCENERHRAWRVAKRAKILADRGETDPGTH